MLSDVIDTTSSSLFPLIMSSSYINFIRFVFMKKSRLKKFFAKNFCE